MRKCGDDEEESRKKDLKQRGEIKDEQRDKSKLQKGSTKKREIAIASERESRCTGARENMSEGKNEREREREREKERTRE